MTLNDKERLELFTAFYIDSVQNNVEFPICRVIDILNDVSIKNFEDDMHFTIEICWEDGGFAPYGVYQEENFSYIIQVHVMAKIKQTVEYNKILEILVQIKSSKDNIFIQYQVAQELYKIFKGTNKELFNSKLKEIVKLQSEVDLLKNDVKKIGENICKI